MAPTQKKKHKDNRNPTGWHQNSYCLLKHASMNAVSSILEFFRTFTIHHRIIGSLKIHSNMPPLRGSIRWVGELLPRCRPSGARMSENLSMNRMSEYESELALNSSEEVLGRVNQPQRGDILVGAVTSLIMGAPEGRHLCRNNHSFWGMSPIVAASDNGFTGSRSKSYIESVRQSK